MGVLDNFNLFRGIRRKLLGYFLVLTILPLGILSYSAFISGRNSTEERVMAQLTSIADMKRAEIESWLNEIIKDSNVHANNYVLINYLQLELPKEGMLTPEEMMASDNVESLLAYYKESYGYDELHVTNHDGVVVASSNIDYVGSKLGTEVVQEVLETKSLVIKDIHKTQTGKYVMQFCNPVFQIDDNGEQGAVLGSLLINIDMETTLYPVIRSWPGMGSTGETLLARIEQNDVVFINELRHSDLAPLTLRIPVDSDLANPAQYATQGQSSTIKALDYRGVQVVSAYRNIPLMNWGFVAKIDQTEAFAAVNTLLYRIVLSSFLLVIFAIVLGFMVSDRFTSRIIEIEQTTKDIAKGKFQHHLEMDEGDEIGSLAQSVNQMSEQLSKTFEVERQLSESIAEANAREQFQSRLQYLYEHALELNDASNDEEVAASTLNILRSLMENEYLSFLKVVDGTLSTVFNIGGSLGNVQLPLDTKSITTKAVRERESIIVSNVKNDPDYFEGIESTLSELAVPVFVGNEVYGVINLESNEIGKFDSQDRSLVELLGLHVSSAIARIRSQEIRDRMYEQLMEEQIKTEQAIELDRLKTNFMSTATHEIRTPLTSIRGYSELIEDELEDSSLDEAKYYFEIVQKNIDRLKSLTDDLLDLQRIESGRMHLEKKTSSLRDMIDQVSEEMQPILEAKNQILVIQNDSEADDIIMDEMRIMQVLVNYISNAQKYSDENTSIFLVVQDRSGAIRIQVRDSGIGIREVDIEKLFKPFPDIDMEHVRRGTGLGLSICKGIVELHGGKVDAQSEGKGMGSTFSFEIPVIS